MTSFKEYRQRMLTERYDTSTGTYVGIEYDQNDVEKLLDTLKDFKIPDLYNPNLIHTTLMYSKDTQYIQVVPELIGKYIDIENPQYKIYGKNRDTLVIAFDSDMLQKRHKELTKLGLKHSWPDYSPHITLSESVDENFDTSKLPKLNIKKLKVVIEKSTPLKD